MKFQIECNRLLKMPKTCLTCQNLFEMGEARVIVCNDEGDSYGDICPHCIAMGSSWLGNKIQRFDRKLSS
uniref:Uncharacterized protein n=1 Tax=Desertifilum tharense IPPAS B-1220 TaxID=1781255 RepID=A0A1E5QR95_9CYAN|nr:hypothetical protein BH720_00405 [Desertifilum tharense IPPAS B-1220]